MTETHLDWHADFQKNGLEYLGKYTPEVCRKLFYQGQQALQLADEKESQILVHYYLPPEFQKIAHKRGDSLALSLYARDIKAKRVDFQSVYFMGATAKVITDNNTRVFVSDSSKVISCSLVEGTNYDWIENWKRKTPGGVVISYINSSLWLKSISDYICTSSNSTAIIMHALANNPGKKILIAPDKFLGDVMKIKAINLLAEQGIKIDKNLIEVYRETYAGNTACCYVHEKFGPDQIDVAMLMHPNAEVLIHPECGCATVCMRKLTDGLIPFEKAFVSSTKGMIDRALASSSKEFIVATEAGHLYTLREQVPDKVFYPVTGEHCKFMKANNFDKLLRSLKEDRIELIICEDCDKCIDPRNPYEDEFVSHLPRVQVDKAKKSIDRMLSIQ